jgi:hypothetical protein
VAHLHHKGFAPLLFFQTFILNRERKNMLGAVTLHKQLVFRCRGRVDRDQIASAIYQLELAHPILNSRVRQCADQHVFEFVDDAGLDILCRDFSDVKTGVDELVKKAVQSIATKQFDLANERPLRGIWIRLAKNEYIIGLIIHHIVADARALEVIRDEFFYYISGGHGHRNSPTSLSFGEYTRSVQQQQSEITEKELIAYWTEQLGNLERQGPIDRSPAPSRAGKSDVNVIISRPFAIARDRVSHFSPFVKQGLTINQIFLAAHIYAIRSMTNSPRVAIECHSSGRVTAQSQRTVGCLVQALPLLVDTDAALTYEELVRAVRNAYITCIAKMPVGISNFLAEMNYRDANMPVINWMGRSARKPRQGGPSPRETRAAAETNLRSVLQFELYQTLQPVESIINPGTSGAYWIVGDVSGNDIKGVFRHASRYSDNIIDNLFEKMDIFCERLCEQPDNRILYFH